MYYLHPPPVNVYFYLAINIIQNKREHILNKQQQRFLKKNLLLVTQNVNIILGECELYIIIMTGKVILEGGVIIIHYTGYCNSRYQSLHIRPSTTLAYNTF